MRRFLRDFWAICIVIQISLSAGTAASASPTGFSEGVADFNARRYSSALQRFQAVSRANPNDAMSHYYMGLCYQYMSQMALAAREYQWVASAAADPRLKAQAQSGLAQVGRYQAHRTYQGASTPGRAMPGGVRVSGLPTAGAAPSKPAFSGRLKVYDFYTTWCGPCKKYAPIFESVSARYGSRAEFRRVDAEADTAMAQKFGISAYPTTIFADSNDKLLAKEEGVLSASALSGRIESILGGGAR